LEGVAIEGLTATRRAFRPPQFPQTKFRPMTLPDTLVARPGLRDRLTAGADRRLTVVVGPAGAGKSVLLADWAAARPPGLATWFASGPGSSRPRVRSNRLSAPMPSTC
jgi:ATP/maltotriose-dependent transcriptional regulator MalT